MLPIKLSLFICTAVFWFPHVIYGQKIENDEIDFRDAPGFDDLRECVRDCFADCWSAKDCYRPVPTKVGCETNKCLCSPTSWQLGLEYAATCAKSCETEDDPKKAQNLYSDYCKMKGYTLVESKSSSNPAVVTPSSTSPFPTDHSRTTSSSYSNSDPAITSDINEIPSPSAAGKTDNTSSSTSPFPTDHSRTTSSSDSNSDPAITSDINEIPSPSAAGKSDNTSSAGGSGSDFGTAEIVGTILGILGLFVAILTLWVTWRRRQRRKGNGTEQRLDKDEFSE